MLNAKPIAELWPTVEAVLAAGGCFRLWPHGRSMRPLLREGRDSVLLVKPEGLAVGDIALVRTEDGHFILHRVIALTEKSITLAGDALLTTEGPMPRTCVLARVSLVYRDESEIDPRSSRMRRYASRRAIRRRVVGTVLNIKKGLTKG